MKWRSWLILLICLSWIIGLLGATNAELVGDWNDVALQAVKTNSDFLVPAAHHMAIVSVAVYDAINCVEGQCQPYRVAKKAPPDTSAEAAAATAAYYTLSWLYPEQQASFDVELEESLAGISDGTAKDNGIDFGKYVAGEIIAWRAGDHSTDIVGYNLINGMGYWQPTPPSYTMPPFYPNWPLVTPFVLRSSSQCRPPAPPPMNSYRYGRDFNEVKLLGAKNSTLRTPYQTDTAFFWGEGNDTITTIGRWDLIARQVAERYNYSSMELARLLALVNVSQADGGLAAWDCKYAYNFWRPITGMKFAAQDGNAKTNADANWEPLLNTPPFPEYISGHATFSGAAATILAYEFGNRNSFTVDSFYGELPPRSYTSFWQAASECAASRVYGGVHYKFSDDLGLATGREIGRYAWTHYMRPLPPRRR